MNPRTLIRLLALYFVSTLTGVAEAAQPVGESLEAQLRVEERLLESTRDQYREARALERDVLRSLQTSSNAQDGRLNRLLQEVLAVRGPDSADDSPAPAEPPSIRQLRTAERELAGTRETALSLARDSANWRHELIARAARIRELRLEIARQGGLAVTDPTGLDGLWQIELEGLGITGVVDFDSEGTLVNGSYRLTDGSQGSIRGTLTRNRLDLDRIDWARGFDTNLRGDFDAAAGVIDGTWTAVDVSGGAPGSGSWRAIRVTVE